MLFRRVFRGAIVGLLAAFAAYSVNGDYFTSAVWLGVAVVVAAANILAEVILTLMVVVAIGTLVWTYTPVGTYVAGEIQKRIPAATGSAPDTAPPGKSQ